MQKLPDDSFFFYSIETYLIDSKKLYMFPL